MDPIKEGAAGAAVEDIQERLERAGYEVAADEREQSSYGPSTAAAVTRFRLDQGLSLGAEVDASCWSALVDESYELGDRTLYLRLPNFHGRDVRTLQERLNILGFSCGEPSGYYDAFTETAVRQFQENVGVLSDGMAFQDTIDAIERLRHVWAGKPAAGPHPTGGMGFARAASVLDRIKLAITGDDPVSRHVSARIANLASATNERSGIELVDFPEAAAEAGLPLLLITMSPLPKRSTKRANVEVKDPETLAKRIRTAFASSRRATPTVRLQLPVTAAEVDGSFTMDEAQALAIMLLDAICEAFAE